MNLFHVREQPLSVDEALQSVASASAGGLSLFLGTVRDHEAGLPVTRLEYHAYASMAEKQMRRIGEQIELEVPNVQVAALHRVGSLAVGEIAVICAASAPHRAEAFLACRLLIDRIKEQVPIWKREHGPNGPYWARWQDARCTHDPSQHGHAAHGHAAHDHVAHDPAAHHPAAHDPTTHDPTRHGQPHSSYARSDGDPALYTKGSRGPV